MKPPGRDRLRALLDAVLDEDHDHLADMAQGAHTSPFHFHRQVSRMSGEPPAAMRRRVMLERASWQLRRGATVTDVAFEAGYDSVEGFSRAFARAYGYPPSQTPDRGDHWLPTPNGVHFHPPTSLWVDASGERTTIGEVTTVMLHQDVDDVRFLLEAAKGLDAEELGRRRASDLLAWDGPDGSIATGLEQLVRTKEVWLASIAGEDVPPEQPERSLVERHDAVAARWLAAIREIDRRGGWGDRLIDALCDPPESFPLVGVVAHVLTFSTARRQRVRGWLRDAGALPNPTAPDQDEGDPLNWLTARTRGTS